MSAIGRTVLSSRLMLTGGTKVFSFERGTLKKETSTEHYIYLVVNIPFLKRFFYHCGIYWDIVAEIFDRG
jgi:hypothetical protein